MVHNNTARQILLSLTAFVYVAIAGFAIMAPDTMAQGLGYVLQAPNGYSEFFAVYVGVWLATAGIAVFAAQHIRQSAFGDIVAVLVAAQAVGRCMALLGHGWPTGSLLYVFALEGLGGIALLVVRPSANGVHQRDPTP